MLKPLNLTCKFMLHALNTIEMVPRVKKHTETCQHLNSFYSCIRGTRKLSY